jgi:protein-S-isoprenylcysteine O-methyltransferase Ste14
MIGRTDTPLRLTILLQLLAIGAVRAYFGALGHKEPGEANPGDGSEPAWLTATLAMIALVHFGAILAYLTNPSLLRWSAFEAGEVVRWIGILLSCFGMAGEIWAAFSLGASYSPALRIADEQVVVTAGPYRWIRHPLYAFWLPVMLGWGLAACNWFIVVSGSVLIFVLVVIRVPQEETMMLKGFGESYREYMTRTGRFLPRSRAVLAK